MRVGNSMPPMVMTYGVLFALGAAVLFGVSTPLAKLLIGQMDPWLLAGLLYLGSGLGMTLLLGIRRLVRGAQSGEAGLSRTHLPWLAGATLAGGVVAPVLLAVGLTVTSGATAALLLNLESVFTGLLAWLVVREHTDRRLMLGMLVIVAGGAVLAWPQSPALQSPAPWWGAAAIVAACLCWGIDNTCTRPVSSADPLLIVAIKGTVAGTVNVILALVLGAHWPSGGPLMGALVVGLLGYGVSLVLFVLALRHLGSGRTGAYFAVAPFVGAALALALGEPWSWTLGIAGILMAMGLWLHLSERHAHEHLHVDEEHDHAHQHDQHHQHDHLPDDPAGSTHSHRHQHRPVSHSHPHVPDLHHRHSHP